MSPMSACLSPQHITPMRYSVMIVFLAFFLNGCVQLPPLNFSPVEVPRLIHPVEAKGRSVAVNVATDNEKQGSLEAPTEYKNDIADLWVSGLEDALDRARAFTARGERQINVRVKILKLDLPFLVGIGMTTRTTARYEIEDRANGRILFREEISSEGAVPWNYSYVGEVRVREAMNRSVRNSILKFLRLLDEKGLVERDELPRPSSTP